MTDRFAGHVIREAITTALRYTMACLTDDADAVLATRIPQACQTCEGSGWVGIRTGLHEWMDYNDCPDCPTIGTLLLYGWNVATADRVNDGWHSYDEVNGHTYADDLLAALRKVPT